MAKTAFLFPGQGAQHVGMGRDFYEAFPAAREIFDRAEAVSNLPIRSLCFEGPAEDLARTDHAQPCIFTVSAAMLACWDDLATPERRPRPDVCAGLSLGEYTALYVAGAMDLETGVNLVARRGELMQQAATARPSAMVALIGADESQAEALCAAAGEGQVLTPANFNCPGQIVLSGETDACRRAAERAEEFGARGATMLNVAGAFHSEIMAPAAAKFEKTLIEVNFRAPTLPVLANVDAQPYASAEAIRGKLLAQLTGAVRWQQSMEALLAGGATEFYEVGPGKVLAGLMRRIDRKTKVNPVHSRQALEELAGIHGEDVEKPPVQEKG